MRPLRILPVGVLSILLTTATAGAQLSTAQVSGRVADESGAVLPGVTVTALNLENGNTFVDVSDAAGNYRLALRPGLYKVTAELPGFTPAVRDKLELLIGQRATIDLRLTLSGLAENITVTGEAPLVDTSTSRVGGNIDRRQVEELPVNGRNFVDLTMLAPGSRSNHVIESATPRNNAGGVASIAAGMVTTLGWEIYARYAGGYPYGLATVYPALLLSLIALVGVSLATPPPTQEERDAIK